MLERKLQKILFKEGYQYLPSNLPEFSIYYKVECNFVNVLHVVNFEKNKYITEDQHIHMKRSIEAFFRNKGIVDIHALTLIIGKKDQNTERMNKNDHFCWILSPDEKKLYITEGHTEDFYGIRSKLEEFLCHYIPDSEEEALIRKSKKVSAVFHKEIPYVTAAFVILNILIYGICTFTGELLYNIGAFHVESVLREKEYHRIIMSIFLHWDIHHLLSNMLVLYYLGSVVEIYFGHFSFVFVYFFSAVCAKLFTVFYEIITTADIYSVGASGAVFGVMGSMVVLAFLSGGRWKQITLGRMFFMIAYSLYSGLVSEQVNNAAHIGGLIGGVLSAVILQIVRHLLKKF